MAYSTSKAEKKQVFLARRLLSRGRTKCLPPAESCDKIIPLRRKGGIFVRMRKKPNLIPRMERCARVLIPGERARELRGRWRELMPQARPLHLELGCGKGRFTAETAAQNPDVLFIAVERVPDAMVIAMERCVERGLTNVFFLDTDAAGLTELFAPGEADRIYINFCDPWPGQHHARRRLTSENFLLLYRQVLREGGEIHFKTDNRDLFEWSLFQFPKAGYALSEVTRDLHQNGPCGVMTDYEAKFYELGTPINRCVGTKLHLEQEPDCPPIPGPRPRPAPGDGAPNS